MPRTNNKQIKGKKELKEELEKQEQRIAELEYRNEAQLFITYLFMKTALIDIRDGVDVKDCFPLPDFDAYKRMVGGILQGAEDDN